MKEPEPEYNPNEPADHNRILKAVTWLGTVGKTKAQAEDYLKRSMEMWTDGDLDALKVWGKKAQE
jgi:hypothetical protein